jgi:hypothetical protein
VAYNRICDSCGLPIPKVENIILATSIPCSEFHIRCVRCQWPVPKYSMDEDNICDMCKGKYRTKKI